MTSTPSLSGPGAYELRVSGHLDDRRAAWFDGVDLTRESDGTTTLRGPVADQAALHGLLTRVRDLGMILISVRAIETPDHLSQPRRPRQGAR
jgi:hypothetical protein